MLDEVASLCELTSDLGNLCRNPKQLPTSTEQLIQDYINQNKHSTNLQTNHHHHTSTVSTTLSLLKLLLSAPYYIFDTLIVIHPLIIFLSGQYDPSGPIVITTPSHGYNDWLHDHVTVVVDHDWVNKHNASSRHNILFTSVMILTSYLLSTSIKINYCLIKRE